MSEIRVEKITVTRESPGMRVVCGCGAEFWRFTEEYVAADLLHHLMDAHEVNDDGD